LNFLQELQSGHTIPTRIVTQPCKTHNSCSLKHDLKRFLQHGGNIISLLQNCDLCAPKDVPVPSPHNGFKAQSNHRLKLFTNHNYSMKRG
jgi:hypothetical protein